LSGNVEAKTVHEFKASAERVFDAWLDPIKVRSWAAQPVPGMPSFDIRRVEIDARVGGKFTFSDMREEGEAVHWGYYLEIDRPRKLVFTWFTSEEEEQENNSVHRDSLGPVTQDGAPKIRVWGVSRRSARSPSRSADVRESGVRDRRGAQRQRER
jgi:uncharacterized protein YndB with AHSA1/START domain